MKVRYPKIETVEDMARAGVKFPAEVVHEGLVYWRTGKLGMHIATGRPSAEYSRRDEHGEGRVWAFSDGTYAGK